MEIYYIDMKVVFTLYLFNITEPFRGVHLR